MKKPMSLTTKKLPNGDVEVIIKMKKGKTRTVLIENSKYNPVNSKSESNFNDIFGSDIYNKFL